MLDLVDHGTVRMVGEEAARVVPHTGSEVQWLQRPRWGSGAVGFVDVNSVSFTLADGRVLLEGALAFSGLSGVKPG